MPADFEPAWLKPQAQVTEPAQMEVGSPQWVVDTWRKLYFNFPSPGLKQRVAEAEQWATEQGGSQ
jgi:hypothetical protein